MNAKTQNVAISLLVVVSIILGGLICGSLMSPQAAQAGTPMAMNQYIVCPTKLRANRDVVFVIDVLKGRMNTYTLNGTKTVIDPALIPAASQYFDLNKVFENPNENLNANAQK